MNESSVNETPQDQEKGVEMKIITPGSVTSGSEFVAEVVMRNLGEARRDLRLSVYDQTKTINLKAYEATTFVFDLTAPESSRHTAEAVVRVLKTGVELSRIITFTV